MSTGLLYRHQQPPLSTTSTRIMSNHSARTLSSYQGSFSSSTTTNNNEASGRLLSTLESSHNECNRRRRGSESTTGSDVGPQDGVARASSSGPTLRRQSSSTVSSSNDNGDTVVIEEKRRRAHGEGYSIHKYLRGRLLGKGGFAKVYLCTALDTNKKYAVKIVPKANLTKSRARQKLQAEIKIHRLLKHAHICEYKHFFEDRDNCYILLELCHNQSMNEMIKRRKRLSEPEAAFFMRQLLQAVQYMHVDQQVIHRDLKLGNLFLDKHLHIKVGDLGLATRLDHKDEKRKTICGTPNYIAPEVIQGDKAKRGHSFEVDVWSMGVILFTILVGKPPYEAKDVKATYQRILNNEYSFPDKVQVSDCAKDLIRRMLQTKPVERPTLDEIATHPFLTDTLIPDALPSNATHVSPIWRVDEQGHLVAVEKAKTSRKPSLPRLTGSGSGGRQPFGSRDPNLSKGARTSSSKAPSEASGSASSNNNREVIDVHGIVKTALATMGSGPTGSAKSAASGSGSSTAKSSGSSSAGFKIFDESGASGVEVQATPKGYEGRLPVRSGKSTPRTATLDQDELVTRTKSLSLVGTPGSTSSASRKKPQLKSPPPPSTEESTSSSSIYATVIETDTHVLQRMVDRLDTVLDIVESRKGAYRTITPRPLSRGGPTKWVSRYVDYTTKYGLGFLLNEGSSGVYFNDSTKTALEADGDAFIYLERSPAKSEDGGAVSSGQTTTTMTTYSLSSYPDSLKKKVTLLKHFRNYLLEQQKKADEDDSIVPSSVNAIAPTSLVYVKKWTRTRHAILFRLSDQTVQVVFYDQTEVLLTNDDRFITYVDKSRNRNTYHFTDELVGGYPELAKRLKYVKEILQQLAQGQRR